jgi:hypothetical protein
MAANLETISLIARENMVPRHPEFIDFSANQVVQPSTKTHPLYRLKGGKQSADSMIQSFAVGFHRSL